MWDYAAERRVSVELIECWLAGGPTSDEFSYMTAHAAAEFEAETVISTLTAIACVLVELAAEQLGGEAAVVEILKEVWLQPPGPVQDDS